MELSFPSLPKSTAIYDPPFPAEDPIRPEPPPPDPAENWKTNPDRAAVKSSSFRPCEPALAFDRSAHYNSLRCTPEDQRMIGEIISSMGRYSLGEINFFQFIANAGTFRQYERDMESIAVEKAPLHPFKFLEAIFGNPSLKKYMRSICGIFFLRMGFMSGVVKGMSREAHRNNLEPYIDPFSRKVGVSPEAIRPLIRDRAWEMLVHCLIEADGAPGERKSQA